MTKLRSEPSGRSLPWRGLLCISGGLAIGALLSLVSWAVLRDSAEAAKVVSVTIADGTAARIDAGEQVVLISPDLSLRADDALLVQNDDSVPHRIGNFVVLPGESQSIPLYALGAQGGRFICTFHSGGAIDLSVAASNTKSPASAILPTLLIGLPLGLVVWGSLGVASRLDD